MDCSCILAMETLPSSRSLPVRRLRPSGVGLVMSSATNDDVTVFSHASCIVESHDSTGFQCQEKCKVILMNVLAKA